MAFDLGNFATGVAGGAATGSSFGPIGTAIGGIGGGILSLFGKKKKKNKKQSTLDPRQEALYRQSYDALQGKGPLADIYSHNPEKANENFDRNIARPAYRSYEENIVPTITGQYRKNNTMNSSYSGEALARSGRDVQENLDAQRYDYLYRGEENAKANKRQGAQNLLNMNTQEIDTANNPSLIDDILNAGGAKAKMWFEDYLSSRGNKRTISGSQPAR